MPYAHRPIRGSGLAILGSACFTADNRACSSAVEQGTHNPLVPGSNPGGPSLPPQRSGARRLPRRSFCEGAQISFSIFDFGFAIVGLMQQLVRVLFAVVEITILSALVLVTRCANYRD